NEMIFQLIFIGIGAAAIGEEMLFRGFLLNHINTLFGKNVIGTTLAIVLQAIIFGVLHHGVQGMVSAGVIGVILAIFYLLSNRNLLVVMIAHAVPDVLSIISSYQSQ
ncbi:MAG: CPBP family intramembrane glutamic endopeptidase, partial [Cyclobacteriaceae bacterium]